MTPKDAAKMSILKTLQTMLRCHRQLAHSIVFVFPEHITHESSRQEKKKVVADYKRAMSQANACLEEAIRAFVGDNTKERKSEMVAFAALIKQTSVTFDELKAGALYAILADVRALLTAESAKIDKIFTREAEKQNFDGPCMQLLQYAAQVSASISAS
jgi:hypothetical protein